MFQVEDHSLGDIKYVTRSKARVIDNEDPLKKGRIRVFHPIVGETGYIPYLSSPGTFSVPEVGDVVYLEAEAGDETHTVAWGNLNKEQDSSPEFPKEFQRVTPTNRGFFTPDGHLIELDDGKGLVNTGKGIRITTSGGNKITVLEDLTAEGGLMTLETAGGTSLTIDGTKDKFDLLTTTGTEVSIDGLQDKVQISAVFGDSLSVSAADGIQASTPTGTSLSMKNGAVEVSGTGGKLKLFGGQVGLGGPTAEVLDLMDQQLDAFINNAPSLVFTVVGPGQLSPAVVTLLTQIKILLTTIKGGI